MDFADAIKRLGEDTIRERYGNLFEMYENITGENAYKTPMRIYPAVHYTMGGLWVDYELQSNIPGLFVIGEANFSDHGANRLGASALMQGLADGYFVLPYTIGNYLAPVRGQRPDVDRPEFKRAEQEVRDRVQRLLNVKGKRTVDSFHKEIGKLLWDECGMARSKEGLEKAIKRFDEIRKEFWSDVRVLGNNEELNVSLEKAGRVADFIDFGQLMCEDALNRNESCGGHFRVEYQTPEGEALRNDDDYFYVSAWKFNGEGNKPALIKEPLNYETVKLATRSYK
jgi:succinate dehydrogenase / fumarate reductase flavoprotein subunit